MCTLDVTVHFCSSLVCSEENMKDKTFAFREMPPN